jgi:hypothetical protein
VALHRVARGRSPAPATRHADLPHDALRQLVHSTARALQLHIWRFTGLSTEGLFCIRARAHIVDVCVLDSALRAAPAGLRPFPQLRRPVTWIFCRMASSRFPSPSVFPAFRPFGETRFAYYSHLLTSSPRSRALRPAQSGVPDTTEISRGKIDRPLLARRPRCPVFVHRAAGLLHAFSDLTLR